MIDYLEEQLKRLNQDEVQLLESLQRCRGAILATQTIIEEWKSRFDKPALTTEQLGTLIGAKVDDQIIHSRPK